MLTNTRNLEVKTAFAMVENPFHFDVVIIGGGPAGLSSLFRCSHLGLKTILFEKEPAFGGQMLRTFNSIENYFGIEAISGNDLRDLFISQIPENVRRLSKGGIVQTDLRRRTMTLSDGSRYSGRAVILATGVRRRKLNVVGEEAFYGRGVLESGVNSKDEVKGKTVVIVGGGDAAIENALILSTSAAKVIVVHRRDSFSSRPEFLNKARNSQKIDIITNAQITAISGNDKVDAVEIRANVSGKLSRVETDAVLIRVGVMPNSELFHGQIGIANQTAK